MRRDEHRDAGSRAAWCAQELRSPAGVDALGVGVGGWFLVSGLRVWVGMGVVGDGCASCGRVRCVLGGVHRMQSVKSCGGLAVKVR